MIVYSSKRCWEYGQLGHPESPERVKRTCEYLQDKGFELLEPEECSEEDILRAHTEGLLAKVKSGNFFDPDTPFFENVYSHACLSAGAAILAAEAAAGGEVAFSLMRPPGHHATSGELGGFCYFNNMAIAVKHLINNKPGTRAAILDIDVHHGNGTEEIFLGQEEVLFLSLHQVPLYPGSGLRSERNCLNFPLRPGTDEKRYLETLETALKEIQDFKASVVAVSAGFDTYAGDPLAQVGLEKTSYEKIGRMITSLDLPRFALLEGGYSADIPECIDNFLLGFEERG